MAESDVGRLEALKRRIELLGVSETDSRYLVGLVARGEITEEELIAKIQQGGLDATTDQLDAGAMPGTADVIGSNLEAGASTESQADMKAVGASGVDPFNMDRASGLFSMLGEGAQRLGGLASEMTADEWGRQTPPFMGGVRTPLSEAMRATGSDASLGQQVGEAFLGGIWSFIDTAALGIPGLIESTLERTGVTEKGFFGGLLPEWIEEPTTAAGRIGSGIGSFAGFVAPLPFAPAAILGKAGKAAVKSKGVRTVFKLADKSDEAVKGVEKVIKTKKGKALIEEIATKVTDVDEVAIGAERARGLVKRGLEHVLGSTEVAATKDIPKIMRDHDALRAAAGALDKSDDYVGFMDKVLTNSKMGAAYHKDVVKSAAASVAHTAANEGIVFEKPVLEALEKIIGQATPSLNMTTSIVNKARSGFGLATAKAVEHAIQLGAGMAAYKALRYGVVEQLKGNQSKMVNDDLEKRGFDDYAKQLVSSAWSGMLEGVGLGLVKGAIPNIGYRRQGVAMQDLHTAMGVGKGPMRSAWRTWNKLTYILSGRKKGFNYFATISDKHLDRLAKNPEGQQRLFAAAKMMHATNTLALGEDSAEYLAEYPIFSKAAVGELGGESDAKALVSAMKLLRNQASKKLFGSGVAELPKEFAATLPRMVATVFALNFQNITDKDMWREYPEDQIFSILTAAYIGHGSAWHSGVAKYGAASSMDIVYARQWLAMLGAHSPQAQLPGPGGKKGRFTSTGMLPVAAGEIRRQLVWEPKAYEPETNPWSQSKQLQTLRAKILSAAGEARNEVYPNIDDPLNTRQINNAIAIVSNLARRMGVDKNGEPLIKYEDWTPSQFLAVAETLKNGQPDGDDSPNVGFYTEEFRRVGEAENLAVIETARGFVKDVRKKIAPGEKPEDAEYHPIRLKSVRDPLTYTKDDLEVERLVKFHNAVVGQMANDSEWSGQTNKKFTAPLDREEALEMLRPAEEDMTRALGKRTGMTGITKAGDAFTTLMYHAYIDLGKNARHDLYYGDRRFKLAHPVELGGKDIDEVGRPELEQLFIEAGGMNEEGTRFLVDKASGYGNYLDTMIGFGDMISRSKPNIHLNKEVQVKGVSAEQYNAAARLNRVLTDLGMGTTVDQNRQIDYLHKYHISGEKLPLHGYRLLEALSDAGVVTSERGSLIMSLMEEMEVVDQMLDDGTIIKSVVWDTPISNEVDPDRMEKLRELRFLLTKDIESILNSGLVGKVRKLIPGADVSTSGVMVSAESLDRFLEDFYGDEVLEMNADVLIKQSFDALFEQSHNVPDTARDIRPMMGRLWGLLKSGNTSQILKVFRTLRAHGLFNPDAAEKFDLARTDELNHIISEFTNMGQPLDYKSEAARSRAVQHFEELENIAKSVNPVSDLSPRSLQHFARDFGLPKEKYVEASLLVQKDEIADPIALKEWFANQGAKVPQSMKREDFVALYAGMHSHRTVEQFSFNRGSHTEEGDIATGEGATVQHTTYSSQTTSVLNNMYMKRVRSYVDDKGQSVLEMFVIDNTGNDRGKRIDMFGPDAGEMGIEFLQDLITGDADTKMYTSNRPAAAREEVDSLERALGKAFPGKKSRVIFTHGIGTNVGTTIYQVDDVNNPSKAALQSAYYIRDYAADIVKALEGVRAEGTGRLSGAVETARKLVDAFNTDLGTGMKAYQDLMGLHMERGGYKMSRINLNSDISHIYTLGMILQATGPGYIQQYLRDVGGTEVGKFSGDHYRRANRIVNNHFDNGNRVYLPKLGIWAEGQLDNNTRTTTPKFEVMNNPSTGEDEVYANVLVVGGDGWDLMDGSDLGAAGLFKLLQLSGGSREVPGTMKNEVHKSGGGTNEYFLSKGEMSVYDMFENANFWMRHGVHLVLPKTTLKILGDFPIEGDISRQEMAEYLTKGGTHHISKIKKNIIKVPLSSIINMSTPTDGAAGAVASLSKQLGQMHPTIIKYLGETLSQRQSGLNTAVSAAMSVIAAGKRPGSLSDVIEANIYINKILNSKSWSLDPDVDPTDSVYSAFEHLMRTDRTANPFAKEWGNIAINLIRKRVFEPAVLDVKNPHGTSSIVQFDLAEGTSWGLNQGEVLAPFELQNRIVPKEKSSIAIREGDRYEYLPLNVEGLTKFVQKVASASGKPLSASPEALAKEMLDLFGGQEHRLGNFDAHSSNGAGANTAGRLWEVLQWAHNGFVRTADNGYSIGESPYQHSKGMDNRLFRYGIAGPMFRIPTTTADDTVVGVVTGFNSAKMGNQMIMHSADIGRVHGDADGDKINFSFDAVPDVLREFEEISNSVSLHVNDRGEVEDIHNRGPDGKATVTSRPPWQLRRPGEIGFDFLDPDKAFEYSRHHAIAKRNLATSITYNQAFSEFVLRSTMLEFMDRNSERYSIVPRGIPGYGADEDLTGVPGSDPRHRLRFARYARSPAAVEAARMIQMFVSQPGHLLPEEMGGGRPEKANEWLDYMIRQVFGRRYGAATTPSGQIGNETQEDISNLTSADVDIITRVLMGFRGIAGALSGDWSEGTRHTYTWDSLVRASNTFIGERGNGNLDNNSIMARVLASYAGSKETHEKEALDTILRTIGYEPPEVAPGDRRPGEAVVEADIRRRARRDLAPLLANIVRFGRGGAGRPTSLTEEAAQRVRDANRELNKALYKSERFPDDVDMEYAAAVKDWLVAPNAPELDSKVWRDIEHGFDEFPANNLSQSIDMIETKLGDINGRLKWVSDPREQSALLGLQRFWNARLKGASRAYDKARDKQGLIPKGFKLNAGRKSGAPKGDQIPNTKAGALDALDRSNTGLAYMLTKAHYEQAIDNPEYSAEVHEAARNFRRAFRSMRSLAYNSVENISVPRNILQPDGPTDIISPTDSEMASRERIWMRQIFHAYSIENPDAAPFIALTLAAPLDIDFKGEYDIRTRRGVRSMPIWRDPYNKVLLFYMSEISGELGTPLQRAARAGGEPVTATEIFQHINMNRLAMQFGMQGADMSGLDGLRSGIVPLSLSRSARGLWGKSLLPDYEMQEMMNTENQRNDMDGLPEFRDDGSPRIDHVARPHFYSYETRARVLDDAEDARFQVVRVYLTNNRMVNLPTRVLANIIKNNAGRTYRRVRQLPNGEAGVFTEHYSDSEIDTYVNNVMDEARVTGALDVENLGGSAEQALEAYAVRVQSLAYPRYNPKDVAEWSTAMRGVTGGNRPNYLIRSVMESYDSQMAKIGILPETLQDQGFGNKALLAELDGQKREVKKRLDGLFGVMAGSSLLMTFYHGYFPFREWVMRVTDTDPFTPGAGGILTVGDARALEKDWVLTREGLGKVAAGPGGLVRKIWSTKAFLYRTPMTRDLDRNVAMQNQEFMTHVSSVSTRIKRIEKMIHDYTGEKKLLGMMRKLGLSKHTTDALNEVDTKLEHARKLYRRATSEAQAEKLRGLISNLETRRKIVEESPEYQTQHALIKIVHGVESFEESSVKKYAAGEAGQHARALLEAYPELAPIAAEAKGLLLESERWLRDGVRTLSQSRIRELERRMRVAAGRPLTKAETATLDNLKKNADRLGYIKAYFPFIKPTDIAGLNTAFNAIIAVRPETAEGLVQVGRANEAVEKFVNNVLGFSDPDVELAFTKRALPRRDFSPKYIENFLGSLSQYANSVAAFQYRAVLENHISNTIDKFYTSLRMSPQYTEMFGKGVEDMIDYLDRLRQDGLGPAPDDLVNVASNIMRGLSTVSKIGFSPITVGRQASQKLLNWFVLGPKVIKDAKVLLSGIEHQSLVRATLDYAPVGFADTSSQRQERMMRLIHGNDETMAAKVQEALSGVVQKGLYMLKNAPILGEVDMRREAFAAMFAKTYRQLQESPALKHVFKYGKFSDYFIGHYPEAGTLHPYENGQLSKEWLDPNGGGQWVKAFKNYLMYQSKAKAYEMVRAIHFDYSKIAKPEFLRNPALAALFHLRSYDFFHTELFVDAFKQLQYMWKAQGESGGRLGKGFAWRASEVSKSPEFNFMMRIAGAYALIGTVSALVPAGIYQYLRPGTLDTLASFSNWLTGLGEPNPEERKKRMERLFFGKGVLTAATGPILSDMIDAVNLLAADQFKDPSAFTKYVLGFRDYTDLPGDVKFRKWLSKGSAEAARLTRDLTSLTNAAAAGQFAAVAPGVAFKHFGLSPQGIEPHEEFVSQKVAQFVQSKTQFMPGMEGQQAPTMRGDWIRSAGLPRVAGAASPYQGESIMPLGRPIREKRPRANRRPGWL